MSKYIEKRHEIDVDRRILDVRPWSVKMQERLSDRSTFLFFVAGPLAYIALTMPFFAPLAFIIFVGLHLFTVSIKSALPFRYPANMKGSKVAPKADGIMYFGAVRERSPFEKFKQCWLNDSDLRKHILIMGSTGSGKSETLKGIFYNALCWGSGFFCADGKADNKLPTDGYTMCRAFGRDDDILHLNFLLGDSTPQQVARSRRKRSNGTNPFSNSDADTIIQMGANLLPKAEGDGKSWQEKALVVWRSVITALCYKRDHFGFTLSVGTIIDYLALAKIEELYVEGFKEAEENNGEWSYGYVSIKNYLDSGLPGFSTEILQKKHKLGEHGGEEKATLGRPRGPAGGGQQDQAPAASEQHGYRTGQLMPVLNLLDKTYGHIFQAKYSEIDMIDVALRNRILFMLIPSLEKSAQEAENLGKLAIACLRVMMARNLGSELEGTHDELIESKATASNYPYIVALDELGYYFADGIAVMFAQARSLGMCMLAASQDLEKLTEGSRQAEAGAMIGNTVNKIFMKIDDPEKTYKLVENTVGKSRVAQYGGYEAGVGVGGVKRSQNLSVTEEVLISYQEMQKYTEGQAVMNALGVTQRISTFYMGHWLEKLGNESYHLNRFMQVDAPLLDDIAPITLEVPTVKNEKKRENGQVMMAYLRGDKQIDSAKSTAFYNTLARVIRTLDEKQSGLGELERGIVMYEALKAVFNAEDEAMRQVLYESEEQAKASNTSLISEPMQEEVERRNVDDSLDEFGLIDPLSLIRKNVQEVVEPVKEEPKAKKPVKETLNVSATTAIPSPSLVVKDSEEEADTRTEEALNESFESVLSDDVLVLNESANSGSSINDILKESSKHQAPVRRQAPWVMRSMAQASTLKEKPRASDNSVVGIQNTSLAEVEAVERALGNETPKTAAKDLEKVVASSVTPKTIPEKDTTLNEIDGFFNEL